MREFYAAVAKAFAGESQTTYSGGGDDGGGDVCSSDLVLRDAAVTSLGRLPDSQQTVRANVQFHDCLQRQAARLQPAQTRSTER